MVQGGFNSIDVFVKKGNTFVLHCHDNSPKSHVQVRDVIVALNMIMITLKVSFSSSSV